MRLLIASVVLAFTLGSLALAYQQQQQRPQAHKPASQNTGSPSAPKTVVVNQPAPSEKTNAPEKKTEHRPIWSNWALVAVGIVAAIVAIRSLRAIEKQAKATEDTATAAKDSALAVINAERAWVMVDVGKVPGQITRAIGSSSGQDIVSLYVRFICSNEGKTPAWITEKTVKLIIVKEHEALPPKPDFSSAQWVVNEPEPLGSTSEPLSHEMWLETQGTQTPGDRAIVYGLVKYRDVFADGRVTTFGYSVSLNDQFSRLSGYPEYNKNT